MDFEKAKKYILERLSTELPGGLYYHSYEHTLDVLDAAERICDYEKIDERTRSLIFTAVVFHDSGFIYVYDNHEIEGCRIASEVLPGFNYTAEEIAIVNELIMATKIPQTPKDHAGMIICDADLDYLGRDDFKPIAQNLFLELHKLGRMSSIEAWNAIQVKFLGMHTYFTEFGQLFRKEKKGMHLEELKRITGIS